MSASVSESIGKLLLEGYKMLADSCDVCSTVLMQDRRGRVICVNCESASMANAAQADIIPSGKMNNGNVQNSHNTTENMMLGSINAVSNENNPIHNRENRPNTALAECEEVLIKEMQNATATLQNLSQLQHDVQGKLLYVRYIRECAETIQALKGVNRTGTD